MLMLGDCEGDWTLSRIPTPGPSFPHADLGTLDKAMQYKVNCKHFMNCFISKKKNKKNRKNPTLSLSSCSVAKSYFFFLQ